MAGLHLERLIQDCRDSVFRNASMWARDEAGQLFDMPRRKLADNLCLNGCSGNGACDRGFCRCHADFVGSDCSQAWLPDGYSQIFRLYAFGPLGLRDYGSAMLRCKI